MPSTTQCLEGEIKVECKKADKGQTLGKKLLEKDCFVFMQLTTATVLEKRSK